MAITLRTPRRIVHARIGGSLLILLSLAIIVAMVLR